MLRKHVLIFLCSFACISLINANDKNPKKTEKDSAKKEELTEQFSETNQSIKINGKEISYKATAGNYILKDEDGDHKASIFFISYTKEGERELGKRPITFCFNGGPGSSAIWLHLGVFGPKKVKLTDEGIAVPPYQLINNEHSILDVTDLVFIDPVSTGYSKPASGEDPKQFHGVEEDIKSIAEFIHLYVTRNERWESPKFIAGESYGTTRAAGLAGKLHDDHHMHLNGIVLVSSVLNFQTMDCCAGNDLSYILFLPTYTASAWYHNRLAPDLQKNLQTTLKEVEKFAQNEYAQALMKGDLLSRQEREQITKQLCRYTGLSPQFISHCHMRIDNLRFAKELLRSDERTIGRFDSRFKGIDEDAVGEYFDYDPSSEVIFGAFTAAFNHYVHSELKWKADEKYKVLTNVFPWDFGKAKNQYLNVAPTLREIMTKNPHLKVFVASGYYDLATPYFATVYTFNHLGLDSSLQDHIKMGFYEAGHMMYTHKPSLITLKQDLSNFYKSVLN